MRESAGKKVTITATATASYKLMSKICIPVMKCKESYDMSCTTRTYPYDWALALLRRQFDNIHVIDVWVALL